MTITRHYDVPSPGIRFALISDLQDKEYGNLIDQIKSEAPDAILLTGNIITRMDPTASEWNWEKMDKWLTRIYGKSAYEQFIDGVGNKLHSKYSGQNALTQSHGMTFLKEVYKLNPEIQKIMSPVILFFPNGDKQEYDNGKKAAGDTFNRKYMVSEMRAVIEKVEVKLTELEAPNMNWSGEESVSFFNVKCKHPSKRGTEHTERENGNECSICCSSS